MTALKSKKAIAALLVAGLLGFVLPASAGTLKLRAHIPWGRVRDFEFFRDGVFITGDGAGIEYYTIDDSFHLTHRYTINPGGYHYLCQFCVVDTLLFALDGGTMHTQGTPVFFVYSVSESTHTMLAGLEPSGTVWVNFDPIIYHQGSVMYHQYPGNHFRIDVTDPLNPRLTGSLRNTNDVCHCIIPYQDTLLITTRKQGTANYDGNFRVIRNNDPDSLISLGTYARNRYSFTYCAAHIGQVLFTCHSRGFAVYDISDLSNVNEIYFYSTEWERCVEELNNYLFVGCDNGLHVFHYQEPGTVEHLLFWPHDRRVLRMRPKWEADELWCFYDGGTLGGLVVLDVSDYTGIEQGPEPIRVEPDRPTLCCHPNPFRKAASIAYSLSRPGNVELNVYDPLGNRVKTLVSSWQPAGEHRVVWQAGKQPAGTYFLRLRTKGIESIGRALRLE